MIKTLFRKKKHFFLAGLTLKFTFLIFFSLPYILQQVQSIEKRDEIKASIGLLQNHNIRAILPEKIPDDDNKAETESALEGETIFIAGVLGNYEPKALKKPRHGPGENGEAVVLTPAEAEQAKQTIAEFGFNMIASDKVSLNRAIKDTRSEECKFWHYPKHLPKASVVIVFHNEGWTTLLRTVHSVLNTTPKELLEEIILVDDFSNTDGFEKLKAHIKTIHGNIRLHKTEKREGLVQARTIGAKLAKGEVIVILDAHCECVVNWLPPLLARIKANRKTLAVPLVDGLEWNTLLHTPYWGSNNIGIFEWGLLYKEMPLPDEKLQKKKHQTEPNHSPTHAGGLLAIAKSWFEELGYYDDGIKIWGGEQYELSFKVWQCGGVVEWVPCSRVAHLYRGPRTKSIHPPGANGNQPYINYMRLAEVWMDEYKEYLYTRKPYIQNLDFGDITQQLELKKRLQCKPFKWYMDEVAPDLLKRFPVISKNKVWGSCKNIMHDKCINTQSGGYGEKISVSPCFSDIGSNLVRLNFDGELSYEEQCLYSDGDDVRKKFCLDNNGIWMPKGEWNYDDLNKQISSSINNKCLQTDGSRLFLAACNNNDTSQKWEWHPLYI